MLNVVLDVTFGEMMDATLGYVTGDLMTDVAVFVLAVLMLTGALLMLLASVGLLRLPDLPTRMHASTKAGSLGAALIMLAVAVAMPEAGVVARSIAVISFLLLTAPVAAHIIGRAGYFTGVPLWEGTVKDDLANRYDYEMHTLESGDLAERDIKGWDEGCDDEVHEPYDPLVDDEPPPHADHPVEKQDATGVHATGTEEVTYGDAAAERAEGQSHETPPPEDDTTETEIGDHAGESPETPAEDTDEVSKAEADAEDFNEDSSGDEVSPEDGDEADKHAAAEESDEDDTSADESGDESIDEDRKSVKQTEDADKKKVNSDEGVAAGASE